MIRCAAGAEGVRCAQRAWRISPHLIRFSPFNLITKLITSCGAGVRPSLEGLPYRRLNVSTFFKLFVFGLPRASKMLHLRTSKMHFEPRELNVSNDDRVRPALTYSLVFTGHFFSIPRPGHAASRPFRRVRDAAVTPPRLGTHRAKATPSRTRRQPPHSGSRCAPGRSLVPVARPPWALLTQRHARTHDTRTSTRMHACMHRAFARAQNAPAARAVARISPMPFHAPWASKYT